MTALSMISLLTGGFVASRSGRGSEALSIRLERIGGFLLTSGLLLLGAGLYVAMD